jgi:gliding motility-associated-like protein
MNYFRHKLVVFNVTKAFIFMMLVCMKTFSQCNWSNLLSDSFESSATDFIPGTTYSTPSPYNFAARSGSNSVYLNFIDSNSTSPAGTRAGTLFYRKTVNVCPNTPYRVSMWFCTTFSGLQCKVKIVLKDGNGAILNAVNNLSCPYAPGFAQYNSGIITPTTSTIVLDLYTNVGGSNGNDLGVDDLLVEQCLTPGTTLQTTLCSASPTLNLHGLFGNLHPAYGTWAGPSTLSGGHLGNFNPAVNLQGKYVYSYNFQNNSSCALIKDTVTVAISQTPTLSINQATICVGQQTATLTAGGAINYSWSPAAGLNTTSSGTVIANPSATTIYTIVGANGNCRDTITSQVVADLPPVVVVNSATICSGSSATLTASGASVYSWSPASSLNANSGATVIAMPSTSTSYSITGTAGSCTATAHALVTVTPLPILAVNSASICTGSTANLLVSGATDYNWFPSTALSASTGSIVTSSSPVSITYTVIGTSDNCSDTIQTTVTVYPMPVLAANAATVCAGSSAILAASGASVYSWSPALGLNTASGPSVIATPSVSTHYVITGSSGICTSTIQTVVQVNSLPHPSIEASSSTINTPGESVSLTVSGGNTYLWSNGFSTPLISVAPFETSSYCVMAISPEGCEQEVCITIDVLPESTLYIPDTFTPNGDQLNDVLYTPGTNIIAYHLVIYNRWGNLIFESHEMGSGWNGTYKGEPVKNDVYNYLLTAEGIDRVFYKKTGSILVLK